MSSQLVAEQRKDVKTVKTGTTEQIRTIHTYTYSTAYNMVWELGTPTLENGTSVCRNGFFSFSGRKGKANRSTPSQNQV